MLVCETMRWDVVGYRDLLRCKFFILLVLVGCSDGYLNIFISQSQVMKLLGEFLGNLFTRAAFHLAREHGVEGRLTGCFNEISV